jgi:hypothetical protein
MLCTFANCAKTVLLALAMAKWCKQIASISSFLISKGGTETIAQLPIADGLTFLSLDGRFYVCKLRSENKDLKGWVTRWIELWLTCMHCKC